MPAVAHARKRHPGASAQIFGDGPERAEVLRLIDEYRLDGAIQAPGFAESERSSMQFGGHSASSFPRAGRDMASW